MIANTTTVTEGRVSNRWQIFLGSFSASSSKAYQKAVDDYVAMTIKGKFIKNIYY